MRYAEAVKMVEAVGMSISDGLAFTVTGGQLVNGADAPPLIAAMNGWSVEQVAEQLSKQPKR